MRPVRLQDLKCADLLLASPPILRQRRLPEKGFRFAGSTALLRPTRLRGPALEGGRTRGGGLRVAIPRGAHG